MSGVHFRGCCKEKPVLVRTVDAHGRVLSSLLASHSLVLRTTAAVRAACACSE